MSIFYINQNKTDKIEFEDKFDIAKFIDGKSNIPVDTGLKVKNIEGMTNDN